MKLAETMMNKSLSMQKQRGVATLIFSMVVLFTLTLTTIFGSRVGLLEEKMSSNDFRAKESMMAAEAGMDVAVAAIQISATGDAGGPYIGTIDSTNGVIKSYNTVATQEAAFDPDSPAKIIKIVSTGCVGTTVCGGSGIEATSTIQQYVASIPVIGESPAAPMVLAGGLSALGNWEVVGKLGNATECDDDSTLSGKEDSCSSGDLVSVWSDREVETMSGSSATCSWDEFIGSKYNADGLDNYDDVYGLGSIVKLCDTDHFGTGAAPDCNCQSGSSGQKSLGPYVERTGRISTSPLAFVAIDQDDKLNVDIVAPPVVDYPVENFPDDLFAYVFRGIPKTSYSIIKTAAETKGRVLLNCSTIGADSAGLYWITGDCDLGEKVGTPTRPVLIVVEDAEIDTNANMEGYGLLFAVELTAGGSTAAYQGNGGLWYGGIIVDYDGAKTAGSGKLVYSAGVFYFLNKITAISFSTVPGTWKDF